MRRWVRAGIGRARCSARAEVGPSRPQRGPTGTMWSGLLAVGLCCARDGHTPPVISVISRAGAPALLARAAEAIEELRVNAAEATIAENHDNFAALGLFDQVSHNGIGIWQVGRGFAGRLQVFD